MKIQITIKIFLFQDGGSSGGQRAGTAGGQNKGGSKPAYGGSYWGPN